MEDAESLNALVIEMFRCAPTRVRTESTIPPLRVSIAWSRDACASHRRHTSHSSWRPTLSESPSWASVTMCWDPLSSRNRRNGTPCRSASNCSLSSAGDGRILGSTSDRPLGNHRYVPALWEGVRLAVPRRFHVVDERCGSSTPRSRPAGHICPIPHRTPGGSRRKTAKRVSPFLLPPADMCKGARGRSRQRLYSPAQVFVRCDSSSPRRGGALRFDCGKGHRARSETSPSLPAQSELTGNAAQPRSISDWTGNGRLGMLGPPGSSAKRAAGHRLRQHRQLPTRAFAQR